MNSGSSLLFSCGLQFRSLDWVSCSSIWKPLHRCFIIMYDSVLMLTFKRNGLNMRISIWIGVLAFVGLSIWFATQAFSEYGDEVFGPSFYGALLGVSLGAALALIVVLINFEIQRKMRSTAMNLARFVFLREQGENLKEAYIRYVDTLRLGGKNTGTLAGQSWKALKREFWPDIHCISNIQSSIGRLSLPNSVNGQAFHRAYQELRASVQEIVRAASTTAIFESKEKLVEDTIFQADFKIGLLGSKLIPLQLSRDTDLEYDLRELELEIKNAATSSGEVLEGLCKLGNVVKIKQCPSS